MLKLKPNATFKAKVMVPVAGGESEPVVFEFRHKTRDQMAEWLKGDRGENDVQAILGIAVGWDLAEPFDEANVGLMVQNYIGSAEAVVKVFVDELTKARLGN